MRALLAGAYDKNGAAPAIAGGSGKHPADAAAAIAGTTAKPARKPLVEPASAAPPRATPVAVGTALPSPATRATAPTLDEAIRHYLEEFATAAGAAAN
jgi:hypothetical protein